MNNSAPGFASHPSHKVEIVPFDGQVIVSINGREIGHTDQALQLFEASYPAVFYLPLDALPAEMLETSDNQTWCTFKGHASYYHLLHEGEWHENAVWTYREPFDEALAIRGRIAIYPDVAAVEPA